jgi:hypothetical protein
MTSTILALALVVSGLCPTHTVVYSDHLSGHPVHDLYDPMVTRQGVGHDDMTLVPDSRMGCWIEDNGYGPEKICGLVAKHLQEA